MTIEPKHINSAIIGYFLSGAGRNEIIDITGQTENYVEVVIYNFCRNRDPQLPGDYPEIIFK